MDWKKAVTEHGGVRAAARAMGIPYSTLWGKMRADGTETVVPEGYRTKGTSTLYDADGNVRLQWVKTKEDEAQIKVMMDGILDGLKSEIPRCDPTLSEPIVNSELLTTYILTDFHLGMVSWGEETGADWDTKIAELIMERYFTRAIMLSPASKIAVFANIGDLLHFDGMLPVTPTSKHVLDADTRYQKLIRVAIRSIRLAVKMMLEKHEQVIILMCRGNHDEASSAWLREAMAVFYEEEPRVTVDCRPDPYYCVEHGETALFFHHGDKRRITNVDTVFASKFREVFGRTKRAYAHLGHLHSDEVKETNLMRIERHRTLAAPDAYSSYGGYMSDRTASAITYHKKYGELSRVVIPYDMLK